MATNLQTLKGFRDFGAAEMALRREVIGQITQVFEKFGFSELQTPAIEYQDVLLGKYGAEAEKLMYLFSDPGDRAVGLKYDLTVPLARYISSNQNTPLPFKRYQIQPVWRAENTQKGRYREFYQCDVDTIGVKNPMADAEILAVISEVLEVLRFPDFTINVNSRQVLFSIMQMADVPEPQWLNAIQSIDKLDKKSVDEVQEELREKGFSNESILSIFASLKKAQPDEYLVKVFELASKMNAKNIQFTPTISRGLDYYDGPIFETTVAEPKIGSVTGGGRYDKLLSTLGGPDLPAVGTTIGLERIIDCINELKLLSVSASSTKVLVTVFNQDLVQQSLEVVEKLRSSGINTEIYLEDSDLGRQLKYADRKQIPYVVVVGPEEIAQNEVKLKNMETGEEKTVVMRDLVSSLSV